jgi:hypothetical protein
VVLNTMTILVVVVLIVSLAMLATLGAVLWALGKEDEYCPCSLGCQCDAPEDCTDCQCGQPDA